MEMPDNTDEIIGVARDILEKLLDLLGIPASVTPLSEFLAEGGAGTADFITLNVEGEDLGILIGRRGQTLACLQYLVRLMVGHQTKTWLPLIIDVEGYKQRRYNALKNLALRIAEQVKASGTSFALEPMTSFDRRIIHLTLVDHPDVTTQSSGEGEARRVVIMPEES